MGNSYCAVFTAVSLCTHTRTLTLSLLQQPPSNQRMRDTSCSNVPSRATPPHCRICLPVPRFPVRPKVQMSISGHRVWHRQSSHTTQQPSWQATLDAGLYGSLLMCRFSHLSAGLNFKTERNHRFSCTLAGFDRSCWWWCQRWMNFSVNM